MISTFDKVVKLARETNGAYCFNAPGIFNLRFYLGTAYITQRQVAVRNADNKNQIDLAIDKIFEEFNSLQESQREYNLPIVDITEIRMINGSENCLDSYIGKCIFFSREVDSKGNEIPFSIITNQISRHYLENVIYRDSDNADNHVSVAFRVGQTPDEYRRLIKDIFSNEGGKYDGKIITTSMSSQDIFGVKISPTLSTLSGIFILARNPSINVGFHDYELMVKLFRECWETTDFRVVYNTYYYAVSKNTLVELTVDKDKSNGRFFKIPGGSYLSEKDLRGLPQVIPGIFGKEGIHHGKTICGKTSDLKEFTTRILKKIWDESSYTYERINEVRDGKKNKHAPQTLYGYLKERYKK